jgi:hypothetical protein
MMSRLKKIPNCLPIMACYRTCSPEAIGNRILGLP